MRRLEELMNLAGCCLALGDTPQAAPAKDGLRKPSPRATPLWLKTVCLSIMALIISAWQAPAHAQTFPARQVRIIVPFAPGAAVDVLARVIASGLQAEWGQPVIVENRPGGNTVIGADMVARAAPDGYTLLLTADDTFTTVPHLYKNLPFDTMKDFALINIPVKVEMLIVAHHSVTVDTLPALIAQARSKPDSLSYGSFGNGSKAHVMMEMLKTKAKIDILHVPYSGAARAVTALSAGEVQISMSGYGSVRSLLESGRMKAIAVAGPERIAQLPNVPTAAERGYPEVDATGWFGIAAPAKTPPEIINRINEAVSRVNKGPEMGKFIEKSNLVMLNFGPKAFADQLARDFKARGDVVSVLRRSGINVEQ